MEVQKLKHLEMLDEQTVVDWLLEAVVDALVCLAILHLNVEVFAIRYQVLVLGMTSKVFVESY